MKPKLLAKRRRRKKWRQALWGIALIISIFVFLISGYKLFLIYSEYHAGTEEYASIQNLAVKTPARIVPEQDDENDVNQTENELTGGEEIAVTDPVSYLPPEIDFSVLKNINTDIVGWLDMGELGISYPIVRGTDNAKYLKYTFENKKNSAGSIFMDYHNSGDFSDCNTIIYGHNMKNGSMFGKLKNIREEGMFDKCRYFWISAPDGNYQYEIFAAYETGAESDTYTLFSEPDESFRSYLETAHGRSLLDTGNIPLVKEDKIITLSTCTGNNETRFVIQGKRINSQ